MPAPSATSAFLSRAHMSRADLSPEQTAGAIALALVWGLSFMRRTRAVVTGAAPYCQVSGLSVLAALAVFLCTPFAVTLLLRNYAEAASLQLAALCVQAVFLFLLTVCYWPHILGELSWRPVGRGALLWLGAYPWVLLFSMTFALIVQLFGLEGLVSEQNAVDFVLKSRSDPVLLVQTLFTVCLVVPASEEILFRGYIQNYLGSQLPARLAILVSSVIFGICHYSGKQGLSNVEIVGALSVFSVFLGSVYWKERSLLGSIALHGTFNAVSCVGIMFM